MQNLLKNKKITFLTDNKLILSHIFLVLISIYIFISTYGYLSLSIFSHGGDTSLFIDIIDKLSKFNDYDASTVHSAFFHFFKGKYLTDNPTVVATYCDLNEVIRKESFNMYQQSHIYFFAWFLSLFAKMGLSVVTIAVFAVSFFNALLIYIVGFFLIKNRVNLINITFFLLIIISWKPFIFTIFGQIYFDRFFIIFMTIFIIMYCNYYKKKTLNKKIFLYLLSFIICSIHERAALMLSVFLLSEIFLYHLFSKDKKIVDNIDFIIIGILSFLYFFIYIKYIHTSSYGTNYSFESILNQIRNIFTKETMNGYLGQKLFIVLFPLIFLSFFRLKFMVISLIAILPNYFISIGGAEKIGFTTHYHSYYIPFLICSALFGFVKFQYYLKKNNFFLIFLIFSIILHNIFFDYSNREKIFIYKDKLSGYEIFDALTFNKKKITILQAHKNFKMQIKEAIERDNLNPKLAISLNAHFMPSFFETNFLIDLFPMGISKSDYLITSVDNNGKIYTPSYLKDKKMYNEIQTCIQYFIDRKFLKFKEYNHFGQKIIIYKKI